MPSNALTSAEISLPSTADAGRVRERIATLADTVDLVGLTDNHAGQPRMSPLAAVALAREQGVGTVVHVSCRDRNRLALQSQVVGAAACFHRDYTGRKFRHIVDQRLPAHRSTKDHSTGHVDANNAARVLAQIPRIVIDISSFLSPF